MVKRFDPPSADRSKIVRAVLSRTLVPRLRQRGFKGSSANLHRVRGDRLDLFSIQFSQFSQTVFFNLGRVRLADHGDKRRSIIHCHVEQRVRIGAEGWHFHADVSRGGLEPYIESIAEHVAKLIDERGEAWWRSTVLASNEVSL
jgi:hypothetical protein